MSDTYQEEIDSGANNDETQIANTEQSPGDNNDQENVAPAGGMGGSMAGLQTPSMMHQNMNQNMAGAPIAAQGHAIDSNQVLQGQTMQSSPQAHQSHMQGSPAQHGQQQGGTPPQHGQPIQGQPQAQPQHSQGQQQVGQQQVGQQQVGQPQMQGQPQHGQPMQGQMHQMQPMPGMAQNMMGGYPGGRAMHPPQNYPYDQNKRPRPEGEIPGDDVKRAKVEGDTVPVEPQEIEVKLYVKGNSYTMKLDTTTITTVEDLKTNLANQLSINQQFDLQLKADPNKQLSKITDIPNKSEVDLVVKAAAMPGMPGGQDQSYRYPPPVPGYAQGYGYPADAYKRIHPGMQSYYGGQFPPGMYPGMVPPPVLNLDIQLDDRYKELITMNPTPPALTEKLPASKTPVIDAFVYCAICGWGVEIIPASSKFVLTDYERYWNYSAKVCSKPAPTKVRVARLKALKRWFKDFPGIRKLATLKDNSARIEVNVKPERFNDIQQVVKRLVQILRTRCRTAYPMYFPSNI